MADMAVTLVAVERRLWSGEATFVLARTTEGELGIMPGHEPTLAQLDESGVVRIDTLERGRLTVAVHGGFLSIEPDGVTILAEYAELPEEIDIKRAEAALQRAGADAEQADARRRAEVRLTVAAASGE